MWVVEEHKYVLSVKSRDTQDNGQNDRGIQNILSLVLYIKVYSTT